MLPEMTIGMACYDDAYGVRDTVIGIRRTHNHLVEKIHLIVVDNNPQSPHGRETKKFVNQWTKGFASAQYIEMPEARGTSPPRDRVFREARTELVACVDSHIDLFIGSLDELLEVSQSNPASKDLWQGVLMYDDDTPMGTHFIPFWRSEMYGIWGLDPLWKHPSQKPFEIPGQGMWFFACHKHAWQGFNEHLRGFGGEELLYHEKHRKLSGGKTLCLPQIKGNHRFMKVFKTQYPLNLHEKVRNYLIWYKELEKDPIDIYNHFVSLDTDTNTGNKIITREDLILHLVTEHSVDRDKLKDRNETELNLLHKQMKLPLDVWNRLIADPIATLNPLKAGDQEIEYKQLNPNQPPENATIQGIYEYIQSIPRDLNQHLPKLKELTEKCEHVTEFTKRRESTVGLLAGQPRRLISYTTEPDILLKRLHQQLEFEGITAKSLRENGIYPGRICDLFTSHISSNPEVSVRIDPIEPTEMLFIDTYMHGDYLLKELKLHGERVSKWIVITGTESFGIKAEGNQGPGLLVGWYNWAHTHPDWKRVYHSKVQYGLTVFSRDPSEASIDFGPGTELKIILHSLGINPSPTCDCNAKASKMDDWGPEGCRENFNTIVSWMNENQDRWGWADKLRAAKNAAMTGIAFKIDWLDPYPGLVMLAIDRATKK